MNQLEKILTFFLLPFALFISCKKNSDNVNTESDKYIIEMTSDYKLEKVSHIVANNVVASEYTYEYSDNLVKIKYNNSFVDTYFLNQNGLADSSFIGDAKFYYHYNQDNYLTSCTRNGTNMYYGYANGNKISYQWGITVGSYQYNSLTNKINIDSFDGTYLGKLNKNLLQKANIVYSMADSRCITTYNYNLNALGLVIERTSLATFYSGEPSKKTVSEFVYIINK